MPDLHYIAEPLRQFAVRIDALRRDPRNARLHPDRNLHAIRRSLRQFGQQKPVVLADDGLTVIAGNGTLEAALLEGWTHLAAITSSLAGRDATAYGLADNRTGESAEWDFDRVGELIGELTMYNYDLGALGWSEHERALIAQTQADAAASGIPESTPPTQAPSGAREPAANRSETTGSDSAAPGAKPERRYVPFAEDQYEIVHMAVGKFREIEEDNTIPEGRALELICADWLSAH